MTNTCNKSLGKVLLCEILCRGQSGVLATSPTNSNQFEFLGQVPTLVPQNACELFVEQVPATTPFVQTLQGTSCRDYMCSPLVCADLYLIKGW